MWSQSVVWFLAVAILRLGALSNRGVAAGPVSVAGQLRSVVSGGGGTASTSMCCSGWLWSWTRSCSDVFASLWYLGCPGPPGCGGREIGTWRRSRKAAARRAGRVAAGTHDRTPVSTQQCVLPSLGTGSVIG